ncbi:uncharacterized protein GGS25DRAFT_354477 [Hypoxylon fragiforme]|uniref:uncharacterized protein n=1 Tax=Hypoxylon fragiforme TaxID=63214 RepID=UPI0020C72F05|nr:uncharacterized protein GGS25DRAFT_354477 [Hypoxylon fragiforme]KAI2605740.1 hypothetical protein GGS25DRAFT_354477 [Hypoxylon fragiforme]
MYNLNNRISIRHLHYYIPSYLDLPSILSSTYHKPHTGTCHSSTRHYSCKSRARSVRLELYSLPSSFLNIILPYILAAAAAAAAAAIPYSSLLFLLSALLLIFYSHLHNIYLGSYSHFISLYVCTSICISG